MKFQHRHKKCQKMAELHHTKRKLSWLLFLSWSYFSFPNWMGWNFPISGRINFMLWFVESSTPIKPKPRCHVFRCGPSAAWSSGLHFNFLIRHLFTALVRSLLEFGNVPRRCNHVGDIGNIAGVQWKATKLCC